MKNIIILLLTIGLLSCGGGGGSGPNTTDNQPEGKPTINTFIGGANRGVLLGDQLGGGTALNSNLVKIVSVSPYNIGDFSIGPAYLSRDSGTYIIPVRNLGSAQCSIKLQSVSFKDSSGTVLFSEDHYVTGSVSNISNLSSCLGTGERGYVLSYSLINRNVDNISQVTVSGINIGVGSEPTGMPTTTWKPLSYNIVTGTSFMVTIQNTGSIKARPGSGSVYILFDDQDIPLYYAYLNTVDTLISPNDTTVLMEDLYYYDGIASKMEVFINNY